MYLDYTKALHEFLKVTFNIPCYIDRNEPSNVLFPYCTYDVPFGRYSTESVGVKIRTNDGKLKTLVDNVDKLEDKIGEGVKLEAGNGFLIIRRGAPFAQIISEDIGENIKTLYVNLEVQIF